MPRMAVLALGVVCDQEPKSGDVLEVVTRASRGSLCLGAQKVPNLGLWRLVVVFRPESAHEIAKVAASDVIGAVESLGWRRD